MNSHQKPGRFLCQNGVHGQTAGTISESDERIGLIRKTLTRDLYFLCDVSGVGAINRTFSSTRETDYFSSGRVTDWTCKASEEDDYLQALKAVLIRYAGIFAAHIGI